MIRNIVFDMDGILFDTERMISECWYKAAAQYNIVGIDKAVLACIGLNSNDTKVMFQSIYHGAYDYDLFHDKVSQLFREEAAVNGIPLKSGVSEILSYLKEEGYRIGLASSTRKSQVETHLKDAGLYEYFNVLICGDMVSHSKPSPEIYLKACSCLHANPKETYAVEDSFNGIRSAHDAGMKVIMIPDLLQPTAEISKIVDHKFSSMMEFEQFLKRNNNMC